MRRRWRKWQMAVVVLAIALLLWGATLYDDVSAGLSRFSHQIAAVSDWLCPKDENGKRGECTFDEDKADDAPDEELNGLRALIDALPLGWATASLFPAEVTLRIPRGQSATLSWSALDDERVMVGRIALVRGTLRMTLRTETPPSRACKRLGPAHGGTPAVLDTRVAVDASIGTTLDLSCETGGRSDCEVVLDDGSSDLTRDGQC